jgi:hypothetical protein
VACGTCLTESTNWTNDECIVQEGLPPSTFCSKNKIKTATKRYQINTGTCLYMWVPMNNLKIKVYCLLGRTNSVHVPSPQTTTSSSHSPHHLRQLRSRIQILRQHRRPSPRLLPQFRFVFKLFDRHRFEFFGRKHNRTVFRGGVVNGRVHSFKRPGFTDIGPTVVSILMQLHTRKRTSQVPKKKKSNKKKVRFRRNTTTTTTHPTTLPQTQRTAAAALAPLPRVAPVFRFFFCCVPRF